MSSNRKRAHQICDDEESNTVERQNESDSEEEEYFLQPRRRNYDFFYCALLDVYEVPETVPKKFCKCQSCPPAEKLEPKDAVCCAKIAKSSSRLAKNWMNFIGDYKGCYAKFPKIQNLIENTEELESFMILDGIRKRQIQEARERDRIRGYRFDDKQKGYRFACYRKIAMLVHRTFGAKNYIVTPACIVDAVQHKYPSYANVVIKKEIKEEE